MTAKECARLAGEIKRLTAELENAIASEIAEQEREGRAVAGDRYEDFAIPAGVRRQLVTRNDTCLCRVVSRLLQEKQKEAA
jgi:hypothetical protein